MRSSGTWRVLIIQSLSQQCGIANPSRYPVQGDFLALALIFSENPQLRIRRGAFENDRAALFEMLVAGKRVSFCRGEFENPIEEIANRNRARSRHKRALHAVALSAPFVFDRYRPIDDIDVSIVPGIQIEKARQHAIERCNGDGVVKPRAAIGSAKLQGRIFQRWPDRPP